MLNFPFYNKHNNHLILDKKLRDYIKKSNTDSFNNFAKYQEHKNTKTNSNTSLLSCSLINYRNYSDTFANDKIDCSELENEDYLCNFYDFNDDCGVDFNNNNNTNKTNKTDNDINDNNDNNDNNENIIKMLVIFIGGTTIIGITFIFYKYS
jgi:hypothetical protein